MAKNPLDGWQMLPDGKRVAFLNYLGGAVLVTEHHAVLALRYAGSQDQLDQVRKGQSRGEQLQVGLNPQQCRRLAEHLMHAAERLERDAPPLSERN